MIDALSVKIDRLRRKASIELPYKPSDVIQSSTFIRSHNRKLAVIFPGWHTHKFPVNRLANRLHKRGWAVLWYDFHDNIIEADDKLVRESFDYLAKKITADLRKITTNKPYEHIRFIGISLGNVAMALVAEEFRAFTEATLVAAGDDLAIDMWHGLRTLYLRDEFRQEHISLSALDELWKREAPKNHALRFKGKDVKFILSKKDDFILSKYQLALVNKLRKASARVSLKQRRAGHVVTILRYCLFDRVP